MNRNDVFYLLQSAAGRYPWLYYRLFARKYPFNQMRITPKSAICIEGFPRSANSYAVVAFRLGNPEVSIAHHLHVPAQLLLARHWQIPALVLLREPEQAVASFLVFQKSLNAGMYLKAYSHFYQALESQRDYFVIARFSTVVSQFNSIIAALNQKFNKRFNPVPDLKQKEPIIFERLRKINEQFFPGEANKSMIPDAKRQELKERALEVVRKSPLLSVAQEVYEQWLAQAI